MMAVESSIAFNEPAHESHFSFENKSTPEDIQEGQRRYVDISPYKEQKHLLDLDTLTSQERLFALALTKFDAVRPDYASSPYVETFNWTEVCEGLRQLLLDSKLVWKSQAFYVVVFRSQIPPTTNYDDLGNLDEAAFTEAVQSGGFLKYWFGFPDKEGRNVATCIWRSRDDARRGGTGEGHRRAAAATRALYSHWAIERFALIVQDRAERISLKPWVEGLDLGVPT